MVAALAVIAVVAVPSGTARTATHTGSLPNPLSISATWSAKSLGLRNPSQLAVGPSGAIYVTDGNDRVTEISPAGKVVRRWGKRGSAPGEFRFVSGDPSDPADIHAGVAVSANGDVYVTDSGNGRVEVFSAAGKFIRQFGTYGNGKGQFIRPADLALDKAGNVYVQDDAILRLTKFSPAGKVLWNVSGAHNSDPDLRGHYHLAMFDAHGRLLITNDDNNRVFLLDQSGHKLDAFGAKGATGACDVTSDPVGTMYVKICGAQAGLTEIFDASHALVGECTNPPLTISPRFGPNGEIIAIGSRTRIGHGANILKLKLNS
jgi:DNA-binding beta-propeller fold protein YncE